MTIWLPQHSKSLLPFIKPSLTSVQFPPFLPNHSTIGIPRFGSVHQHLTPALLLIGSPSNEWQDQVISKIQSLRSTRPNGKSSPIKTSPPPRSTVGCRQQSVPSVDTSFTSVPCPGDSDSPRRLRRKVDSGSDARRTISPESSNSPLSPRSLQHPHQSHNMLKSLDSPATTLSEEDEGEIEGEGDIEEAVGQLSLNEDEQIRFHGKASGLHLLAPRERIDGRSEGGIWKFPKARVWPPLPPTERSQLMKEDGESIASMPPLEEQEKLLDLYWKYVHTALPIVYKQSFLENFRRGSVSYLLFSTASADISPVLQRTIPRVPLIPVHPSAPLQAVGIIFLRSSFLLCSPLPLAIPINMDPKIWARCGPPGISTSNQPKPSWHRHTLRHALGHARPSYFWVTGKSA